MTKFRIPLLAGVAALAWLLTGCPMRTEVGVAAGPAPVCPWGYYDYAPFDCAPYGFYGPEWFPGGVFIGAGPWYHGPRRFWGHVDDDFDRHHGYNGPFPRRGDRPDDDHRVDRMDSFHGNSMRDGRGRERGAPRH